VSARRAPKIDAAAEHIRQFALALPGAWEDHPWGESVAKVGKKVFAFFGIPEEGGSLRLSVKLPDSSDEALSMPFTEPTGYGLGRAGWVSSRFASGDEAPLDILCDWIEESYRAIAPKKLVAELDEDRSHEDGLPGG